MSWLHDEKQRVKRKNKEQENEEYGEWLDSWVGNSNGGLLLGILIVLGFATNMKEPIYKHPLLYFLSAIVLFGVTTAILNLILSERIVIKKRIIQIVLSKISSLINKISLLLLGYMFIMGNDTLQIGKLLLYLGFVCIVMRYPIEFIGYKTHIAKANERRKAKRVESERIDNLITDLNNTITWNYEIGENNVYCSNEKANLINKLLSKYKGSGRTVIIDVIKKHYKVIKHPENRVIINVLASDFEEVKRKLEEFVFSKEGFPRRY